jgi:hypothetical protein
MLDPVELKILILVEWSPDEAATGGNRYRLWDERQAIPPPNKGVLKAEIFIDGTWESMSYNKVWGKRHDPKKNGTWLKQKANRNFTTDPGRREYRVRYFKSA